MHVETVKFNILMFVYEQIQYGGEFEVYNNSLNAPKFSTQFSLQGILEDGPIWFSLFAYKFNRKGLSYETSTNADIRRQTDRQMQPNYTTNKKTRVR
jgi:hypothetical protein